MRKILLSSAKFQKVNGITPLRQTQQMKVQIVKNMDFVRDFATLSTLSKTNDGNKMGYNREPRFLHGNPWT
jgi:hypothetical protein